MTPKDPFLEGTFWDKFWAADSLPGAFVPSRKRSPNTAFDIFLTPFRAPKAGTFSTLFGHSTGREAREDLLETFWWISGPEDLGTPLYVSVCSRGSQA